MLTDHVKPAAVEAKISNQDNPQYLHARRYCEETEGIIKGGESIAVIRQVVRIGTFSEVLD